MELVTYKPTEDLPHIEFSVDHQFEIVMAWDSIHYLEGLRFAPFPTLVAIRKTCWRYNLVYRMETVVLEFKRTSFIDVSPCMVQPKMELTFRILSNYYWPQLAKGITFVVIKKRLRALTPVKIRPWTWLSTLKVIMPKARLSSDFSQ